MTGRRPAFFLAVCCALLAPSPSFADAGHDPRLPEIVGVRLGFDGHYKVGYWTPIEVRLRGGTVPALGTVEVVVPDCDGVPTIVPASAEPIEIQAGEERTIWLAAKIGRELESLEVRFSIADAPPITATFFPGQDGVETWHALAVGEHLYLTLGGDAGIPRADNESRPVTVVHFADTERLPQRWFGYDAVNAVVIAADDAESFARFGRGDRQFAALDEWLRLQGKLVLAMGGAARELHVARYALGPFVPGGFQDVQPLRRVDAIEKYADSAQRIPLAARSSSTPLEVARIDSPKGLVVVEEGDLPLVIRSPHGFGEIAFVAFDLSRRPIADWAGRGKFVGRLLGWSEKPLVESSIANRGAPLGFTDLSGQLHTALDQFDGVRVIPFWVVGLSIAGYVLLIGPIDYFVVRRVWKRPRLTWITFPILTVLVGGAAYGAVRWAKGDEMRLNEVHLLDIDATGMSRGTSWLTVFSPRSDRLDLAVGMSFSRARFPGHAEGDWLPRPSHTLLSWQGMPGSAWGAMQGPNPGTPASEQPYYFSNFLDRLYDTPIEVRSTKAFVGRWQGKGAAMRGISGELTADDDRRLSGRLTSRLWFKLEDCLLVYDRWAYSLGTLPAAGETTRSPPIPIPENRRDLQSVLRQSRAVDKGPTEGFAFEPSTYDPASFDVNEILRQMMFYRAANAHAYTSLDNNFKSYLDLSHQLAMNRAILIARIADNYTPSWFVKDSASQSTAGPSIRSLVRRYSEPPPKASVYEPQTRGRRSTFCRFIFDVQRSK